MILRRLSCHEVRESEEAGFVAWADGALRGRRARRLARRLAADPGAGARAAAYREQSEMLAGLRLALPMNDTPDFHPELVGAVARRLQRVRRAQRAAAGAAVALLALCGVWWAAGPFSPGDGGRLVAGASASAVTRPDLSALGLSAEGEESPVPGVRAWLYRDAQGRPVRVVVAVGEEAMGRALAGLPRTHVAVQWRRGAVSAALVAPGDSPWLAQGMHLVEAALPREEPAVAPVVPAAGDGRTSAPEPASPPETDGRSL
ncbi:hypothetical protein HRbin39_01804 [bacterium HR39]|nr:hypothetical protein HRbin39_01804 [bacterium HR39]